MPEKKEEQTVKGLAEGIVKGKAEVIQMMQKNGLSLGNIADMLKLSIAEIKYILNITGNDIISS